MYQRIVGGTDGSDTAAAAVQHALALAKVTGGTVHVVTAWQSTPALALSGQMGPATPMPMDDGAWVRDLHEDVVAQAKGLGVTVESHSIQGPAAGALCDV